MLKKVAFIYNTVPDHQRTGVFAECASQNTVTAVEQALIQGGSQLLSINLHCRQQLEEVFARQGRPDFAFVIAEGFLDQPETLYDGSGAAQVRQVLAELGVPVSHSPVAAMELCRHKDLTYKVLVQHQVNCPWHLYLAPGQQAGVVADQHFPLFVKPAGGGNSVGIDGGSVVHNRQQLVDRVAAMAAQLGAVGIVAETFLPGCEYTVGVIGNQQPVVLPPVAFPANLVRTSEVKKLEARGQIPLHIIDPKEPLYANLRELALRTYTALGCADVIRIDVKTGADGQLYVIDVNGTPSLAPNSSLARMAMAAGLDHTQLINLILAHGLLRSGWHEAAPVVLAAGEKLSHLQAGTACIA